jgi:protein-disulfide isomerase
LPNHSRAAPAAEAALCAHEQGKFWPYHDRLFENQGALGDENLKQIAANLGLDSERFNQCFETGKFRAAIQDDLLEASQLGVNATPSFFINGRFLSGAQPFEAFKTIIDEELAR